MPPANEAPSSAAPSNAAEEHTVNARFAAVAAQYPDRPALTFKPGGSKEWETLTYRQLADRVRRVALGLRALGVGRGDRVALLSENRPEWVIADTATLAAGAVSVPIYPTLPAGQVAHILADSGAKAVVVENAKQRAKIEEARASAPGLELVIVMDGEVGEGIYTLDSVMAAGDAATPTESYEARRDSVTPDDLMALVYTSGTTGSPKGAMLTHGNMTAAVDAALGKFPAFTPPDDVFLSFLPLSHVFERVTSFLSLLTGSQTCYNDSIFKLIDNLGALHPTVWQCVPRVFESVHERISDGIAKMPARQRTLTEWALGVGGAVAERRGAGRGPGPLLALQHLAADKLILSKIRARFGGRLKFFVSGGAPLNPKTATFFLAIGVPILEGWGLTETTAAACANPQARVKVSTVGPAMPGVSVRTADDGELLVSGPTVMRGYWNNPEATAEVIDAEGWFHTGDIGHLDADGYVQITDRKKDILVLSNGKNVAPQPIETDLRRSPLIGEVVLLGDKVGTVGALVVPNFDALKAWAKEQNKDAKDAEALAADPAARKWMKSEIDRLTKHLADYERIKRLALVGHAFSQEGGELTPTLKVKRKVVAEKYGHLLEKD